MDIIFETKKRLNIAKDIASQLKGIVRGVLLGGSMGFGQNYSVTDKSDIDLVVVIDINKVDELNKTNYFQNQIPQHVLDMFKGKDINVFWIARDIDGVETNVFVYETQNYIDFCLLKGKLTIYARTKPREDYTTAGFDGEEIIINRNVRQIDNGFLYEKPSLAEGKYWGDVPKEDFFYSGEILYQEGDFLENLEKQVWEATIEQLVKEHGKNLDLNKINVLNTHWVYRNKRHKLPIKIIEKIKQRTRKELKNYLENIKWL